LKWIRIFTKLIGREKLVLTEPEEGWTFYASTPLLCDVVRCWFPVWNPTPNEEPKRRHVLVLEVSKDETGRPFVVVAHGSGSPNALARAKVNDGFIITDADSLSRCLFTKPTAFNLRKIEPLPWCTQYFPAPHLTRRLPSSEIERLIPFLRRHGLLSDEDIAINRKVDRLIRGG
jgi:hypothetical protein